MQLQGMLLTVLPAHAANHLALVSTAAHPVVARASLGIPDTLAIFVVALVVFGPKRLPEIGKQIGKLVFEFRRASNDFKLQIEEELRVSEQQDRQKVLDMQAAAVQPATPVALSAESTTSAVSTDASPASGFAAMQGTGPEPPDRRMSIEGSSIEASNASSLNSASTEAVIEASMPEPLASLEPPAPLTIQPPSTGVLVSSLPPNHAAKNVMTATAPAALPTSVPPETEPAVSVSAEPITPDTTAHNG